MDAFWCITLSLIILRVWWKHHFPSSNVKKEKLKRTKMDGWVIDKTPIENTPVVNKQQTQDEAELRRQGFDDELVATILPVINNDK